ncbi:MAG: S8 family serine peptidase [Myxococcota bacterium]
MTPTLALTCLLASSQMTAMAATEIPVLVVDTPIDYDHPALASVAPEAAPVNLTTQAAFTGTLPDDASGWDHGTHVAGIIASWSMAQSENPVTIHNAVLFPTPEQDTPGIEEPPEDKTPEMLQAELENMTRAFNWDHQLNETRARVDREATALEATIQRRAVRVVNMSWGEMLLGQMIGVLLTASIQDEDVTGASVIARVNTLMKITEDRYREMIRRNPEVTFIIAAGNDGRDLNRAGDPIGALSIDRLLRSALMGTMGDIPGLNAYFSNIREPNVILVGALNASENRMARFSNHGAESVDVLAPGSSIRSTITHGRYTEMSGTSMAAPAVTGLVARLLQIDPELSAGEVKEIIVSSTDRRNRWRNKVRSGRVNRAEAIALCREGRRTKDTMLAAAVLLATL